MKTLICGGRNFNDAGLFCWFMECLPANRRPTFIIHGNAPGADTLAKQWAMSEGIHQAMVPALWNTHGKAAGPIRNQAMLKLAPEQVIAFPGGTGTNDMVTRARDAGITVFECPGHQPLGGGI